LENKKGSVEKQNLFLFKETTISYFVVSTATVSTATLTESAFKESQVSLQSLWSQAFLVSQEVIAKEANTAKIRIKFFIRIFLKINYKCY